MAKANVTYEEVAGFCDGKVSHGINPQNISCRMVQEAIAPESGLGTISKLIKRWIEDRVDRVSVDFALSEAELAAVLRPIKEAMAAKCADGERRLGERTKELAEQLAIAKGDLNAALNENNGLLARVDELLGEIEEFKKTTASLRQAIAAIGRGNTPRAEEARSQPVAPAGPIPRPAQPTAPIASSSSFGSQVPPASLGTPNGQPGAQPTVGQADLPLPATSNSNNGPQEKPHAQG